LGRPKWLGAGLSPLHALFFPVHKKPYAFAAQFILAQTSFSCAHSMHACLYDIREERTENWRKKKKK